MLIRILADAFEISIKLYQKHSSGKVQELKFTCAQSEREIWMKFYRDPLSTEGKKNEYKFEYMFKRRVCSSCGVFAEQMACGARKLVEFSHNTGYANVYHLGQHTCLPKVNTKEHDDYICAQIKKYPNLTPKNLQPITTRASTSLRRTAPKTQGGPEGYTPRRSTKQNNPPFVTLFFEKNRYKCLGCNSWINKKDFPHPRDILFTLKAIRPFINPRTQQWVHPERNGYFHLDLKCLQLHDRQIEMRQVTVTDDVFMRLSNQQLEYLNTVGILRHITANKKKTM